MLLLGDTFARMGLVFAVSIAIARQYGADGLGAITAASSLALLVVGFSTLGLNGVLVQEYIARPSKTVQLLVTVTIGKLIAGLVLLIALSVALVFFTGLSEMLTYTVIVGCGYLFTSLDTVESLHHAHAQFRRLVAVRLCATVTSNAAKLTAIFMGLDLSIVAIGFALDYVLLYVMPAAVLSRRMRFGNTRLEGEWEFQPRLLTSLLRRTWPMIISGGFAQVNLRADVILLAAMASVSDAGFYAAASRLSDAWSMVATSIVNANYPHLARSAEVSAEQYESHLSQLFRRLIWAALTAALISSLCASVIIALLYGDGFEIAATVLSIHIVGSIFMFVRAVVSKWLIIENLLKFSLVSHASSALVNVTLNLYLIPHYGAMGAAWASVASYAVGGFLFLVFTRRTRLIFLLICLSILPPRFFKPRRVQLVNTMMQERNRTHILV